MDEKVSKLRALTERQKNVLYWLFSEPDITAAEIGKKVFLAESTIRNELTAIYSFLGVKGKKELLEVYSEVFRKTYPTPESIETSQEASPNEPESPSIDRKAPPVRVRRLPLVLVGLVILLVILFFAFSRDADEPTVTPVAVAQATDTVGATIEPTSEPTTEPTLSPTQTSIPTSTFTLVPTDTNQPTATPTVTATNTAVPTLNPQGVGIGDTIVAEGTNLTLIKFVPFVLDSGARWLAAFNFDIKNTSTQNKLLQVVPQNFRLVDNQELTYPCTFASLGMPVPEISRTLNPEETYKIQLRCGKDTPLTGDITAFTVYISGLSTLPDSSWVVEVVR